MKAFLIYYEPWKIRLPIPETVLVAAESKEKAKVYFRKNFDYRLLEVKPIKQM